MDMIELLREGVATPESLMEDFNKQLSNAVQTVAKEKAKEEADKKEALNKEKITAAREEMIDSVIRYLCATGLIEEDLFTEKDYQDISEYLNNDFEQQISGYLKDMIYLKKMLSDLDKRYPSEKKSCAKQEGKDCYQKRENAPKTVDDKILTDFLKTIL